MRASSRRALGWWLVALAVLLMAGAWLAFDPGFGWRGPTSKILAEMSQDEFDRRVHDYVMAHPEVIMDSVNQREARAREKAETDVQKVLQARAAEVFRDPDSPTGGNPNGDVTLVEFFDYNCPYCRQVALSTRNFLFLGQIPRSQRRPRSPPTSKANTSNSTGRFISCGVRSTRARQWRWPPQLAWMSCASRRTWKTLRSRRPSKKISRLPRSFASTARRAS